jgi:hypothetical protein
VGVYRFWRDAGYAAGAVLAGALADAFGLPPAIAAVGAITIATGALIAVRMPETLGGSATAVPPAQSSHPAPASSYRE